VTNRFGREGLLYVVDIQLHITPYASEEHGRRSILHFSDAWHFLSEHHLQSQLNLSTADAGAADQAKLRGTGSQVWIAERGVIERIEELCPELKVERLAFAHRYVRILHQCHVKAVDARSNNHAVSGVTEAAKRMIYEAARIKPSVDIAAGAVQIPVAEAVRPIRILAAHMLPL
jgi:hypothetical protein